MSAVRGGLGGVSEWRSQSRFLVFRGGGPVSLELSTCSLPFVPPTWVFHALTFGPQRLSVTWEQAAGLCVRWEGPGAALALRSPVSHGEEERCPALSPGESRPVPCCFPGAQVTESLRAAFVRSVSLHSTIPKMPSLGHRMP